MIQKHLGSAEVFFLWTLKKCKLNSSTKAISDVHFAKGIEALINLSDDAPAALLDDKDMVADLFRRAGATDLVFLIDGFMELSPFSVSAGGRSKVIQMNKFMKFFADDVEGSFEAELPNAVKVVAQHRLPFTALLTTYATATISNRTTAGPTSSQLQRRQESHNGSLTSFVFLRQASYASGCSPCKSNLRRHCTCSDLTLVV